VRRSEREEVLRRKVRHFGRVELSRELLLDEIVVEVVDIVLKRLIDRDKEQTKPRGKTSSLCFHHPLGKLASHLSFSRLSHILGRL
jgi:hypothetical protein